MQLRLEETDLLLPQSIRHAEKFKLKLHTLDVVSTLELQFEKYEILSSLDQNQWFRQWNRRRWDRMSWMQSGRSRWCSSCQQSIFHCYYYHAGWKDGENYPTLHIHYQSVFLSHLQLHLYFSNKVLKVLSHVHLPCMNWWKEERWMRGDGRSHRCYPPPGPPTSEMLILHYLSPI